LDSNIKHLEVLFCYNFVNGVTYEKEDTLLVAKLDLFVIGTITILEPKIFTKVVANAKTNKHAKIGIDAKICVNTNINTNMKINIHEPIFYFPHTPDKFLVDTTPI
jgi:hypothetical protein